MEHRSRNTEDALRELLSATAVYAPNSNRDYFSPVDAAVAAIIGVSLIADRLLWLADKTRCILNFKDKAEIIPEMYWSTRLGRGLVWYYSDWGPKEIVEITRKAAWAPHPEDVIESGWELQLYDYGNSTIVSKDLMWLMLNCYGIAGSLMGVVPRGYEYGIVRYFSVQEVASFIDPQTILPVRGEYRGLSSGVLMGRVKEPVYVGDDLESIVGFISNDSWWKLYVAHLKKSGRMDAIPTEHLSGTDKYIYIISNVAAEKEVRLLELIKLLKDTTASLAEACAYASKGPLLKAVLADTTLGRQRYAVYTEIMRSIIERPQINEDLHESLKLYLERCSGDDLAGAVYGAMRWYYLYSEPPIISAGASKLLREATKGLDIMLDAELYMSDIYLSYVLRDALHPAWDIQFIRRLAELPPRKGIDGAAKKLHELGDFPSEEEASCSVVEELLKQCPPFYHTTAKRLIMAMMCDAPPCELIDICRIDMSSRIDSATEAKRPMHIFGITYRPWLCGDDQITDE